MTYSRLAAAKMTNSKAQETIVVCSCVTMDFHHQLTFQISMVFG